jgi:putative transposase
MKYHKNIRLEADVYRTVGLPCSITICTKNSKKVFSDKSLSADFSALLKQRSQKNDIPLYAYCIMPDHVHLLISASAKKDVIAFVREIKSLSTGIAWGYGYQGRIWQASFYDHFLRKEDDCREVARYIIQNPVRKGMVDDWRDYGFCGSLVHDL